MEPRTPELSRTPENGPIQPASPERSVEYTSSPEHEAVRHEASAPHVPADAQSIAMPGVPVLPAPVTTVVTNTDSTTGISAADEDLIEKEWVDKIKQVLAETREDPHAREMGIAALQREYLQKRYGKTLGAID